MASGLIVEMHGEVRLDAGLATMLRHHTSTPEEFDAAVRFCQDPFSPQQLEILLAHMGPRLPISVEDVHVERKNYGKVLRCDMQFRAGLRWTSGRIVMSKSHLPDTLAAVITGRPLSDVIDHPYIPRGLVIREVEEQNGQWIIIPRKT